MKLEVLLFAIIASVVAGSAMMVVLTRNVVRCAVWLLFTLIGISMLYFLLGAEFVGATQLIVYVGGTMVLVIFGVMLTAQQQFLKIRTAPQEWVIGGILGLSLIVVLFAVVPNVGINRVRTNTDLLPGSGQIGVGFLTDYLLPFEIISVHLLVVLIGAAYLARAKRRPKDGAS